ncbi:hypothetical protein GCM10022259_18260 [Aquimarina mytili]
MTIGQSTLDNPLYTSPDSEIISNKEPKKSFLKEKKWRKIKRQIRRNKKKFSTNKNLIHTSKTVDTIYLNAPSKTNETRLSDW